MKTPFAIATVSLLLCGTLYTQEPITIEPVASTPSKLGMPAHLKKYNVTIRRFDPKKGLGSGEDFVLPVDSLDEEHAISSTLANAVAFTKKSQGG